MPCAGLCNSGAKRRHWARSLKPLHCRVCSQRLSTESAWVQLLHGRLLKRQYAAIVWGNLAGSSRVACKIGILCNAQGGLAPSEEEDEASARMIDTTDTFWYAKARTRPVKACSDWH